MGDGERNGEGKGEGEIEGEYEFEGVGEYDEGVFNYFGRRGRYLILIFYFLLSKVSGK